MLSSAAHKWLAEMFEKPFQVEKKTHAVLLFSEKFQVWIHITKHFYIKLASSPSESTQSVKVYRLNTVNAVIHLIRGRATTKAQGLMNLHSITAESDRLLSQRNELSFLYLWDHSPSINCSLSRLFITGKSG